MLAITLTTAQRPPLMTSRVKAQEIGQRLHPLRVQVQIREKMTVDFAEEFYYCILLCEVLFV